ncbi:3-oxoacyl-ACP synthase III family protein [Chondromyces apiculatus]|uniref:Beta-ketoacyl-[acyl-carrier-protein] synthase III n=1 Tax=Chondromyces apiculatus DSM 436 TaxID=1192034 RepID=A0A017STF7_9BACT|nr:beta-ketoacyl-ACP synthase III [Chondromyces apiculatus]EYF00288.1 3-oxoacyl-[acyl-carrier-protein] synthase, KASIII [Chondromyces apiculatus DSM 436]
MGRSAILGVGHHVPDKVVTNDDLARLMPTSDEWIQQRTGIRERRFIEVSGTGSSDLALPAARMAIERAGREVKDVDMIVFATLSPDVNFPGSGCFLGHKLGLPGVPALDIRNQCSGFLYGLSIADAWVRAGMYRNILVVGAEVHSTGLDFSERGRDVAVLFGDGAGAALIGESPSDNRGVLSLALHADGSGAQDLWLKSPESRHIPRLTPEMIERGDHFPRMNGKQVFRWATEKMPEVSLEVLKKAETDVAGIDLFVPHQANMRINQLVASKLGFAEDKVVHNIQRYGNTTAATIPIGLSEAWAEGRLKEGATTLLAAFGSGYTWGAAVVRF